MSDPAILIQDISKKYRLFSSPTTRLKERLHPFGRTYHDEFWALKNISFAVRKGSTVGIIGRNGSGKSTLLQIIAGILAPTSGQVVVGGRISALLQLGAGFNPEFTGRENVVLGCLLMGFDEKDAGQRLPEIEEFAGIGRFIDEPVKTYSSGMFARLAFSTAIHVDPDIMIIDEILAVGDARFQEKCYHKLQEFSARGKTTLFVSHEIGTVIKQCNDAVLLDRGQMIATGDADVIADRYIELLYGTKTTTSTPHVTTSPTAKPEEPDLPFDGDEIAASGPVASSTPAPEDLAFLHSKFAPPNGADQMPDPLTRRHAYNPDERVTGSLKAQIVDFLLLSNQDGDDPRYVTSGANLTAVAKVWFADPSAHPCHFGFALRTEDGIYVYGTNSVMRPGDFRMIDSDGSTFVKFSLDLRVCGGRYFLDIAAYHPRGLEADYLSLRRRAIRIDVLATPWFEGFVDLATRTPDWGDGLKSQAILDPLYQALD